VVTVGTLSLSAPDTFPEAFPSDTLMTPVGQEAAPGLALEGYALERATVRGGETLAITLYWRALAGGLPAREIELAVETAQGGEIGAQRGDPAQGRYPTSRWRAGELVADRRLVRIAPEAAAGPAGIALTVAGERLALAEIEIEASDRLYALPPLEHTMDVTLGDVVRLAGFALEREAVQAGEPLALTLYWEALRDQPAETAYVVFVHLIGSDEQIIAQHDGPPTGGEWPTTAWVRGQVIVDTHALAFREPAYRGSATLAVGLYDPATWQRLATPQGEDRVLLPITVTIE